MLNIAHVPGLVSLKYGGFEHFMAAMARECTSRGHRFYCVWEKRPLSEEFNSNMTAAGAHTTVLPAIGQRIRFLAQMALWLRRNRIDVMHSHFNPVSLLSLAAARLVQVPLPLCTIHSGLRAEVLAHFSLRARIAAQLRQSLSARVLMSCHMVQEQYSSLGLGRRRSQVQYLGVPLAENTRSRDEMRQEFGIASRDVVVACIAFHKPIKGIDILLRALSLLAPQFPELRLIQIGGSTDAVCTSDKEGLYQLAEEIGVANRVIWAGHRDDVRDVLECADVYCQPSRSEGLPLAILEAMNTGLPVVATRVGGIPEAVLDGETGLLAKRESPDSLATCLARLLRDPSLRHRMGQLGRERVRGLFDLKRQTRTLVDMYEDMMRIM